MLNLIRLTDKASCKLAQNKPESAFLYIRWIRGFHQILRSLGETAVDLQQRHFIEPYQESLPSVTGINESGALKQYLNAVRKYDELFESLYFEQQKEALHTAIGKNSYDDVHYAIIHNMRLNNHDITKWESDLSDISIEAGMPRYAELISSDLLSKAVETAVLEQESYYPEFVALHQIPELLCAEVNDHTEQSIRYLREEKISKAQEQISISTTLMGAVVKSQAVMVDCLATAEYHHLRDNLGPASGTHSLAIRQHMFRDLFISLWKELETWILKSDATVEHTVVEITKKRHDTPEYWQKHQFINSVLAFHQTHQEWRHEHLHMPRNCLGAGGTKSMIGIPDGLDTVLKMRDASNSLPALKSLYKVRNIKLSNRKNEALLSNYIHEKDSLDQKIILLTGKITREFFPEVQQKNFCPFRSKHPIRKP